MKTSNTIANSELLFITSTTIHTLHSSPTDIIFIFSISVGLFSEPKYNYSKTKPLYLRTARSLPVDRVFFNVRDQYARLPMKTRFRGIRKRAVKKDYKLRHVYLSDRTSPWDNSGLTEKTFSEILYWGILL
jgi:hypothetical protein